MSSRLRLVLAILLAVLLHGLLLLWSQPVPAPRLHVELQLRSASAPIAPLVRKTEPSPATVPHAQAHQRTNTDTAATKPARSQPPNVLRQSNGAVLATGSSASDPQPDAQSAGQTAKAGMVSTPLPNSLPAGDTLPDHPARARCRPAIRYPAISRELDEQGVVVVAVKVDAQGGVQDIRLQQSSGALRLDKALLDSVPQWQFEAARQQGRAEGGTVLLRFVFQLQDGAGGGEQTGSSVRLCSG